MKKKALVVGVTGQDGAYLARHLLQKGYEVFGTSRDAQTNSFSGLERLGIRDRIQCISMAVTDFRSVLQGLGHCRPDEVYNLSGQSSVGLSFEQPVETMDSISTATLNLLEAIRIKGGSIKFYNAGSSEYFGDTDGRPADEKTPAAPRSPYAVAKAAATWQTSIYRDAYSLFACTGILFNHESALRPERFVTQKIIAAVNRISRGDRTKLKLGNLGIIRDWGFAPEYVEAMWAMLQQDSPEDFLIATGKSHSLEEFVSHAFSTKGLNWKEHVEIDDTLLRPSDLKANYANPEKAFRKMNWRAKTHMHQLIEKMLEGIID